MQTDKILEILAYTLPAALTGAIAYYFFAKHVQHEDKRRHYLLQKENQKQSFPLRLQAYERMILFLERINPNRLLLREIPKSDDKKRYLQQLVQNVEQEFEHNLAQQIYMSNECWHMIVTAKNTSLQMLRNKANKPDIITAYDLQEAVLKEGLEDISPALAAIQYIKTEVRSFF